MSAASQGVTTTPLIFVYGTLMKGLNDDWQRQFGALFVGRGTISAKLYDLGDYPGAISVDEGSEAWVKGELYESAAPEVTVRILDEYEEFSPSQPHKSLFVREVVPVMLEGGKKEDAWVYLYNGEVDESKLIAGGDYRQKVLSGRRS